VVSDEVMRVVIDHGMWGLVLVWAFFLVRLLVRSRPGRELGRVLSIEIRWRYLKWKGVSDAELKQLLRDVWNDDDPTSEPPTTV
jgi:hypothetical protein